MNSTIYTKLSSFWSKKEKTGLESFANNKLLYISSTLSSVLNCETEIDIPRIVVAGSQSSGKSSLLNNLIGLNILPTGKEMVTRAPLILHCYPSSERIAILDDVKIYLSNPPSDDEINNINSQIERITKRIAGNRKGIVSRPINLDITAPDIPQITLIDLPGLTRVACTDKGQPKDIKKQIKNLIIEQIKPNKTIICCVMPGREDVEADMALDLVKQIDPDGKRTVGVLTKIDLMNYDSDISKYLLDRDISNDLKLKHGYFAIKKSKSSEAEMSFFEDSKYSHCLHRCGIANLRNNLCGIMVESIKNTLPSLSRELTIKSSDIKNKLSVLGKSIPKEKSKKKSMLEKILINLTLNYRDIILEKNNSSCSYGSKIKNIFLQYRENLQNFKVEIHKDTIEELVNTFNGNHMDYSICSITVLEALLLKKNSPIEKLIEPTHEIFGKIKLVLLHIIEKILFNQHISIRFSPLSKEILKIFSEEIFINKQSLELINELIEIEKVYLWTENKKFRKILESSSSNYVQHIEELTEQYIHTIKLTFENLIPKIIMKHFICIYEKINTILLSKIDLLVGLLEEDQDVYQQRNELVYKLEKIDKMICFLETNKGSF